MLRVAWNRQWREAILLVVETWSRQRISRIVGAVVVSWLIGSVVIHPAERDVYPEFATWRDSFWNVLVLVLSGLESPPRTMTGRLLTIVLPVLGLGMAGLLTASVPSLLIERL